MYLLGFDIGGTKCAVVTALWDGETIKLSRKEKCPTDLHISPEEMIDRLIAMADGILDGPPDAVGISCGGPLDGKAGVILGPPNLPGWDHVEIVARIRAHYGVKTTLQNGTINVFDTANFKVKGETLTSYKADVDTDAAFEKDTEVIENGVFFESKHRSAPYFDIQIDGIKLLNTNFG